MKYTTDILSEIQTWCHYADTIEEIEYGALYNYYAVSDPRGLLAVGWVLPTDYMTVGPASQWYALRGFLGISDAGKKLKHDSFHYWEDSGDSSHYGTNSSKFSGVGGGYRKSTDGTFSDKKRLSYYWCGNFSNAVILSYNSAGFNINGGSYSGFNQRSGFSARPVKQSTTLTDGQEGTYTGNDGRVYKTICIGTQEWLAENLQETKFRDGSDIPEITDNSQWISMTTAARCVYDNDPGNVLLQ